MRCVIVDDNVHFLRSAREALQREGIAVIGTASTTSEALELVAARDPELVLVDIDLGQESGLDLANRLAGGGSRVILISAHARSDFADLIQASAALGFVSKSDLSAVALSDALRKAP